MAYEGNRTAPAHMNGGNAGRTQNKKKKSKKGVIIAVAAVVVVIAAAAAVFGVMKWRERQEQEAYEAQVSAVLDVDTFYHGVVVNGIDLGGMTMDEAREALTTEEQNAEQPFSITLTYNDQSFTITQDDVDHSVDTDAVLETAYEYGRTGTREERYEQVTALEETPVEYTLSAEMGEASLRAALETMTASLNTEPKDASVTAFNAGTEQFDIADGTDGVTVDLDALTADVKAQIENSGSGTVQIPVTLTPCSITADDLRQNLKKLGTYSTTSTNTANGNYNMARAMASINGTCVQPGETFSYFAVVGPAGRDEGYKPANAIVNGKLTPSYGGGICQTSTTLYGAVLRSGLEIVERSNHSIPSTYCPIGQDAAVSWPNMDFKFRNNTEYPIYIVAGMEGKVLTATLYGWQSPEYDTIEVTSWYTETIPALTTGNYTLDNSLAKGEVKLDAAGRKGYRAAAQRTYYKDGVEVRTEALANSYYRPSGPYYSYGPGTDISNQPGATPAPSSSAPASSAPASSAPVSSAPPASQAPSQAPSSAAAEEPVSTPAESGGEPVSGAEGQSPSSAPAP